MTYRERQTIEEFVKNAEETAANGSPVDMVKMAVKHIKALCNYIDLLERTP